MDLSNSFIYKIYLSDITIEYLSNLDILYYFDIGGIYITGIYISKFNFDNIDGILINNRTRRIFFSNINIIKIIPIETI